MEATDVPGNGSVIKFSAASHLKVHGFWKWTGYDYLVEFNTRKVLHFEFKRNRAGVFAHGYGHRALLRTVWVGVQTLTQRHHLLSIHLVSHGVILRRFKFVDGNMFSTDVS